MTIYRNEVTEIEIVSFDDYPVGMVRCFDEVCSEVTLKETCHTVESWRELSAKIEEALLQIHPASTTRV